MRKRNKKALDRLLLMFCLLALALILAFCADGGMAQGDCFPCSAYVIYRWRLPENAMCYLKDVVIDGKPATALARCYQPFQSPLPFQSPIRQQATYNLYLPLVALTE